MTEICQRNIKLNPSHSLRRKLLFVKDWAQELLFIKVCTAIDFIPQKFLVDGYRLFVELSNVIHGDVAKTALVWNSGNEDKN